LQSFIYYGHLKLSRIKKGDRNKIIFSQLSFGELQIVQSKQGTLDNVKKSQKQYFADKKKEYFYKELSKMLKFGFI